MFLLAINLDSRACWIYTRTRVSISLATDNPCRTPCAYEYEHSGDESQPVLGSAAIMVLAKLDRCAYHGAMSEIGAHLKELRMSKRLTVREAAQRAGISNAYLSQIETGQRGTPHAKHLRSLATVYEVPVRDLFQLAGYLDEPELHETEEAQINRAFEFVMADTRFQAGTRVKEGLSMEAKRYVIQVYERVTGARLLDLR